MGELKLAKSALSRKVGTAGNLVATGSRLGEVIDERNGTPWRLIFLLFAFHSPLRALPFLHTISTWV